jgi:hypothetical protein
VVGDIDMTKAEQQHWFKKVNKCWKAWTKCPPDWPQFAKDYWAEISADWERTGR